MDFETLEKTLGFKEFLDFLFERKKSIQVCGFFNTEANINLSDYFPQRVFSKKRTNEFLAGRVCALRAVHQLHFFTDFISIGKNNIPLWPKDLIGSITHCENFAAAEVAYKKDLTGIGIDAEKIFDSKTAHLIEKVVLQKSERVFLDYLDFNQLITLFYSAKESTFKAINSVSPIFLDFSDLQLTRLDLKKFSFEIELKNKTKKLPKFPKFYGDYLFKNSIFYTRIEIPRGNIHP
jgi:enterobactin synthetase component D